MSKKSSFRGRFDKQHGKRAESLLKSPSQHIFRIQSSIPTQLSWKNSLLLTSQTLGTLVSTLTDDEKYPLLKRDNLTVPIQMQFSYKDKRFSNFFTAFLKSRQNFEHFEQKHHPHRFCNFKITDSKNVVR